jgi:hypothetical protein
MREHATKGSAHDSSHSSIRWMAPNAAVTEAIGVLNLRIESKTDSWLTNWHSAHACVWLGAQADPAS